MADTVEKAVGLSNITGVKAWAQETFIEQGGATATQGTITLSTTWQGEGPFTQAVIISDGTEHSKIDLQPDAETLAQLIEDGVTALFIENDDGVFTAYAIGAAPTAALEVQYTRMEVAGS